MPHLVEVAFKGNRKDFFLWDDEAPPPVNAAVIVDADRGEDLGVVHAVGDAAALRNKGTPHGYGAAGTSKIALRLATPEDVRRGKEIRAEDEETRRRAAERVRANHLVMKLSDAEWQWDRKKLTLYFTAEKRVDFRALVRELASMFRTRIELKQIGVRDEAKRLDGIGRCGRQYCSAAWLPELRPVNLGVAKEQHLSLNPSQISGACGRLMCCLRYEHDFYVAARKRYPKEGRIVRTKRGEEKVLSNDIFRDRVSLRGEDGEQRMLSLAELHAEAENAGLPLALPGSTAGRVAGLDVVIDERHDERHHDHGVDVDTIDAGATEFPDGALDEAADVVFDPAPGTPAAALVDVVAEIMAGTIEPRLTPAGGRPVVSGPAADTPSSDASGAQRPHRRRGRRGGRRNRPGQRPKENSNESPNDSPIDGGAPADDGPDDDEGADE